MTVMVLPSHDTYTSTHINNMYSISTNGSTHDFIVINHK